MKVSFICDHNRIMMFMQNCYKAHLFNENLRLQLQDMGFYYLNFLLNSQLTILFIILIMNSFSKILVDLFLEEQQVNLIILIEFFSPFIIPSFIFICTFISIIFVSHINFMANETQKVLVKN